MSFKIIRNDITKMQVDAVVNTANELVMIGAGCDQAIYEAAGAEELLQYRREHVGNKREGEVFLTPGFALPVKFIIHAVSPRYRKGDLWAEKKLRSCYRKSIQLASEKDIRSIAFPLISTGSFGYPKEEGMRIAVEEIQAQLAKNDKDMEVYLVVFDAESTTLGAKIRPELESYIDAHYVEQKTAEEYALREEKFLGAPLNVPMSQAKMEAPSAQMSSFPRSMLGARPFNAVKSSDVSRLPKMSKATENAVEETAVEETASCEVDYSESDYNEKSYKGKDSDTDYSDEDYAMAPLFEEEHQNALQERMSHLSDTFSQYLLYIIKAKGMTNADVYKRALIDKKAFSKIKNNAQYHPQKITALCLCVGARLSLDETKDLLARAGYALSPCDKTDIIFSYFIENGIYDMIELDIQLEEHGLQCLIS